MDSNTCLFLKRLNTTEVRREEDDHKFFKNYDRNSCRKSSLSMHFQKDLYIQGQNPSSTQLIGRLFSPIKNLKNEPTHSDCVLS